MQDDLKKLLKIQEKDVEILKFEDEKKSLPKLLDQLKSFVDGKSKELDSAKGLLRDLQVNHKKLEIELESKISTRQKYEVQLMTVKSNQEYKALEKEIFGIKTEVSRIEDEILERMVDLESQGEGIKRLEAELADLKKKFAERDVEIKNKIKDLEGRLERLKAERDLLVKDVDAVLFKRYTRILVHVHGKAIVPIVDRSCQGCHTLLPPQVLVDIRRQAELIACENCARLLFIPEDLKPFANPDASVPKPESGQVGTSVEPV